MTDIILCKEGLSRQDELDLGRSLNFLGTSRALVLMKPVIYKKDKKPDIPGVNINLGIIFDKYNFKSSPTHQNGIRALDASGFSPDELRQTIEKYDFDILINFCNPSKKKTMHFPSSALNQVTSGIMKQKSMIAIFSPSDLESLGSAIFIANVLGRAGIKVGFCSVAKSPFELRDEKDLLSLGSLLGFNEAKIKESKESIDFIIRNKYYNSYSISAKRN